MATLNKTAKAPVQGNNIAPNPTGLGGNYFDINGNAVSVETKVVCNRVVLVTTLPDDLEAGAYVALVSVTGELSRVSWLDNPTGLFWAHRLKKAVKQLIKFEKDDISPVVVKTVKPESTVVEESVVPPSPVEPEPTAPAVVEPKVETVEPTVQPEPTVEPQVQPEPTPVEPKSETAASNKNSSGKMSLKDIATEDKVAKQRNKYKPGKNSRAQMLAESQRVMQQRKHAKA